VSNAALALPENDPELSADFPREMLKQLKAVDTCGTYEGWSEAQILDPLIMTKERKRAIPIVGDPDETTMARVKAYYKAIASLIEKRSGLMAVPVINLTHEGFGRAFRHCRETDRRRQDPARRAPLRFRHARQNERRSREDDRQGLGADRTLPGSRQPVKRSAMTPEELQQLEKEVAKAKRIASEWASKMHDLVEDRLPASYREIPELAEATFNACKLWAEANEKLKAAKKALAA